ncbi:(d)CMP kinase [[Mycoplasma] gypis]|uniref:Cytidylate kinase n=1 Tax=[Mycoplasma] gypis TaxID=92404 RepID=A0ABZ2RQF6_9BACT|nr:(d)CMP kinase [[Mycoplasma] gypis]MBN0919263.1 (d)CMP kinase [[Mycoplasma] gypis]
MKNKKRINIAIDGPSGVGKSSVAKLLAKELGYFFISSGSIYRLIALNALEQKADLKDSELVNSLWEFSDVKIDEKEQVYFKGRNITLDLRKNEVSKAASDIAVYPEIRKKVVDFLQWYSESYRGVIIDGRDATYRILPNAELKIFLWADADIRAKRRVLQNAELGLSCNEKQILKEIKERDLQDMNRKEDPLICSPGSIKIDSTNMNLLEVYDEIHSLALNKIKEN